MKNTFLKIFSVLFITIGFFSCEDEDKDPLFVEKDPNNVAPFVTLEQKTAVIDFTNPDTSYDFTISTPSNNVASYALSLTRTSGGVVSDTVPVTTVNTFPADFSYKAADLAGFLGIDASTLAAGDRFDFIASSTGNNGQVTNFQNLNGDATGPGQFQGYNHTTFLSCPFSAAEIVGTYAIQAGGTAGIQSVGDTFEVVAGPGPDQYSIVDFGDTDLVINVDPGTGISIPSEDVFLTFASGLALAPAPANAGFTFSCTGTIFLTAFEYTCCGSFPLIMAKQ